MALEIINVGTSPNDGTGDPIRTAYIKCNNNFSQVYSRYQTSVPVSNVGTAGDTAGMYATDSNYFYYCFADYTGNSAVWGQVAQSSIVSVDSIENGNSNIVAAANSNITVGVAGTSSVAVFANTGVYITGVSSVSGNITGGNILTSGSISASGNLSIGNIAVNVVSATGNVVANNISAVGSVRGAFLIGDGYQISNITVSGGTAIVNGNSNVAVAANSNVTVSVNGTLGVATFANTGAYIAGVVSATGNIIASNLQTSGSITATGNITGGNVLTAIISASGNITGGNVLTAIISASGNITGGNISATNYTGTTFSASGNITGGNLLVTGSGQVSTNGNVTGGNLRTATVITNIGNGGDAILNGGSNGVGNIGNASTYFNTVFAKATSAQYADLAECYVADAIYSPGTVVKFGGEYEITRCEKDHDVEVAGVVSTRPAYTMNAGLQAAKVVTVALVGRVPCDVIGPVRRGQMMVSAGDGRARAESEPRMGAVIGKALQDFNGQTGTIEIVVGRL